MDNLLWANPADRREYSVDERGGITPRSLAETRAQLERELDAREGRADSWASKVPDCFTVDTNDEVTIVPRNQSAIQADLDRRERELEQLRISANN